MTALVSAIGSPIRAGSVPNINCHRDVRPTVGLEALNLQITISRSEDIRSGIYVSRNPLQVCIVPLTIVTIQRNRRATLISHLTILCLQVKSIH